MWIFKNRGYTTTPTSKPRWAKSDTIRGKTFGWIHVYVMNKTSITLVERKSFKRKVLLTSNLTLSKAICIVGAKSPRVVCCRTLRFLRQMPDRNSVIQARAGKHATGRAGQAWSAEQIQRWVSSLTSEGYWEGGKKDKTSRLACG